MNTFPAVPNVSNYVPPKDGCSLLVVRRWVLMLLLLGFALVFAACDRPTRVFVEIPIPHNEYEMQFPHEGPVRIRYFIDRTESIAGFTAVADSAYIRTVRSLLEAGRSLWQDADADYFVYGGLQIGRIPRTALMHPSTGFSVRSFYGFGAHANIGALVRHSHQRPFYSVNNFIHETIDADGRSLDVVITDFQERYEMVAFSRFFQVAFARGLSGALFAVDSEFNGVVWDVDGDRPFPGPGSGPNDWTGMTTSTFFILMVGTTAEVSQFSERLFSDLVAGGISFNHTVFLVGSAERVEFPEIGEFMMIQNARQFESDAAQFQTVNLRRLDNRMLGLFRWDGTSPEPLEAEAYQVIGRVGSRYSAVLTDSVFDGFYFSVTPRVWFHPGETGVVSPGTVSSFRDLGTGGDNFAFRTVQYPAEAGCGRFFRRLYLIGETRNHGSLASGFYRISYGVEARAVTPAWVMEKNAETISEFRAAHERGEGLRVFRLRAVYSDIVAAYNSANVSRPTWSGELYLVRRR